MKIRERNQIMMIVRGYRILVKPDDVETTYGDSNIVIVMDERLEKAAQQTGVVVGVGHTCYRGDSEPWCGVGDRILFSKHAGRFVVDPDSGEELMVMSDTDCLTVIT